MENNIENEATKESNAESEGSAVDQISTRMIGLLCEIEDFVPALQQDTSSFELAAHRRNVPSLLENAVRFLTMARGEVSAELDSYNLFGPGDDERKIAIEQFDDSIDENQTKSDGQLKYMTSLIDDCIKLARVKSMRAPAVQVSSSDAEEDAEGAMAAADSGICSSETEDCAADQVDALEERDDDDLPSMDEVAQSIRVTGLNISKLAKVAKQISDQVDVLEEHVVDDLPSMDEVAQSIRVTGLDINKLAKEAKQISEEIEKIDKIVQKLACKDEKERDEVQEKSDFEETEKNDCTSAEGDGKDDVKVATVLEDDAVDSSCSESVTEDETEPETTDEEDADQTRMGTNTKINGIPKPSTFLNEHLMRSGVGVEYCQVNSEEDNGPQSSRYNYRCKVLDMEASGGGRNRAVAKMHVSVNMLSLLADRQDDGTLPAEIAPFTPAQLQDLGHILKAEVPSSSISFLRKECSRMGEKMPCFKTLSNGGPSGEQVFTMQCTALNHTAVGCGRNKRRAKKDAASKILSQYFKSAVDQERAT